ncbi:hypothetical protein [Kitasatospora sp. NBC_00458]|uniref:hypothetical protein n=1 Tax=Kitasatospora sp. NBC_00458 TaxID=2903568 RepID=UPI002E18D0EB
MPKPDGYLYRAASEHPCFRTGGGPRLARTPLKDTGRQRPLRVLSEGRSAFRLTRGHGVVEEAVPTGAARRPLDPARDHQGLGPARPETCDGERGSRAEPDPRPHAPRGSAG